MPKAAANDTKLKNMYNTKNDNTKLPVPDGQLVRISDYIPQAVIDLRYATENNFTGKRIYSSSEALLCFGTVKKLIKVQQELDAMGLRIVVWDAYRPMEAQFRLWEVCPDPTFVADPRREITAHARGNTVDISLTGADGTPVEMPSEFDDFSSRADRSYTNIPENARENALMLGKLMEKFGFTGYFNEWWHYSDNEKYDIIVR